MYAVLALEIAGWILLLKNFGRLLRFTFFQRISQFIIGRVSEWHVLSTTFLFDPAEERTVYADIVTPDGLYKGKIRNHFTNNDGTLAGVQLDETYRFRKQEFDEARDKWKENRYWPAYIAEQTRPKSDSFWTKIAGGTHLFIPANQIGNLNVRYEKPAAAQRQQILQSLAREAILNELISRLPAGSKRLTVSLRSSSPGNASKIAQRGSEDAVESSESQKAPTDHA